MLEGLILPANVWEWPESMIQGAERGMAGFLMLSCVLRKQTCFTVVMQCCDWDQLAAAL